jgi:hypothetical protein
MLECSNWVLQYEGDMVKKEGCGEKVQNCGENRKNSGEKKLHLDVQCFIMLFLDVLCPAYPFLLCFKLYSLLQ